MLRFYLKKFVNRKEVTSNSLIQGEWLGIGRDEKSCYR